MDSPRLRLATMSDAANQHDEPIDLDAIEAQLAEIELMLERLDSSNG